MIENSNDSSKLAEAASKLSVQLTNEFNHRTRLKNCNRGMGLTLGIGSIAFSSLATIFGILISIYPTKSLWKILTPVSATIAATLQATLIGYPVEKRAVFHRLLAAQTESVKDGLEIQQYLQITPDYLEKVIKELQQIKIRGASEEPETVDQVSSLTLDQIKQNIEDIKLIKVDLENLKT